MKHIEKIGIEQAQAVADEMKTASAVDTMQIFNLVIALYTSINGDSDEKVTVEQMRERNGTLVPTL